MPSPSRASVLAVTLSLAACTPDETINPVSAPTWTVPRAGADEAHSDECDACEAERCGDQLAACDAECVASYDAWVDCLFPDGGAWSGFSPAACRARTVLNDSAADVLVACAEADCSQSCGSAPRATFAPAADADFSAAAFLEIYCNGCHNPSFVPPPGKWVTSFSTVGEWQRPFDRQDWYEHADYDAVVGRNDVIACGVNPGELPEGCTSLPTVAPGFFEGPEKFPPTAPTRPPSYGTEGGPMCDWGDADGRCPQPTDFERRRMISWIEAGAPRE